ncbi:MAG: DUF302 domain-containing protein [Alphaproteobacteria bacterium]|nr:DUF302 domain-containing protein [Alphaproteobacteria bacterium]
MTLRSATPILTAIGTIAAGLIFTLSFAPASHAGDDMIVKQSNRSVSATIDELAKVLESKGIRIFGRVDHQANAKGAGLELRPSTVLVFGNPKMGTPLMQENPRIGLDLPMKVLAWEAADGKVYIGYTEPKELEDRYDIDGKDKIFKKMTKALKMFTDKAAGKSE